MRTLQEKYNGINEGAFSKEQFLRDARLQLPNLITQYNGYEDAVQILKNRGIVQEEIQAAKEDEASKFKDGQKLKNTLSGAFYTVDGKDETGGIYVRTEKGLRKNIPSKYFDAYEIVEEVNEARITNKSLPDYRYKVTNDLDKYPYEQILRGLRVELEGMEVTGTPTTDEYKKALAKVLKNLHADEIFYTNQIAATDKKVDDHDQMVAIQGKEKEIKNSVDTFNGLKKAALKEGFKKLIKKVLTENSDPLRDYIKSKDDDYTKTEVENYKKEHESDSVNETGEDVTGASNATGEYEIMMHMLDAGITNRSEATKFFSLNYSDMPEQQIEFLINHYFQEFQDEEGKDNQIDEAMYGDSDGDYDHDKATAAEAEKLYDAGYTFFIKGRGKEAEALRQEALKKGSWLGWGEEDLPPYTTEDGSDVADDISHPLGYDDVDEVATDVTGFPKWRELSQDEKDHIAKFVKDSGDRDQAEYEKRRDERLKAQSDRLDKYIQSQREVKENVFESVSLKDILD